MAATRAVTNFALVVRVQGVSFRCAYEILISLDNPVAAAVAALPSKTTQAKLACPLELDAQDRELMQGVVDYYHDTLKRSPEALQYLQQRGITDPEIIERFSLGYPAHCLQSRTRRSRTPA